MHKSTDQEYDVVIDVLTKHRNILMDMVNRNLNSDYCLFNIMDEIRLKQIDQIDQCISMWKERSK